MLKNTTNIITWDSLETQVVVNETSFGSYHRIESQP